MAEHAFQWPQPSGPHSVGFAQFSVADPSRAALHAPEPTPERELLVLAWYPAADTAGRARRHYMEPRDLDGGHASLNLFQIAPAEQAHLAHLETAAYSDAPVAPGRFPLIVFCHGIFGFPQQNSVLMEHLASSGYIVVSVAHPFESGTHFLPDGRRLLMDPGMWPEVAHLGAIPQNLDAYFGADLATRRAGMTHMLHAMRSMCVGRLPQVWADDLVFVADRIAQGAVPAAATAIAAASDIDRLAYLGMSFGGHVAALCCLKDPRARAGANLDGGVFSAEPFGRELGLPFLALTGDLSVGAAAVGRTAPAPSPASQTLLDFAYNRPDGVPPAWPLHRLGVPGTTHVDFADFPLLFDPSHVPVLASSMPPGRWYALKVRIVGEFFDHYLRGLHPAFPAPLAADYPDLLVIHDARPAS